MITNSTEKRLYAVKLDTNLSVSIVEKPGGKGLLDFCYEQIGCTIIEQVRAKGLKAPLRLVIDEEGFFVDKPVINYIASYLYGTHEHGQPIVGSALVIASTTCDLRLLNSTEAQIVLDKMTAISKTAYVNVRRAMGSAIDGNTDDATGGVFKYFTTQRPPSLGCMPRGFTKVECFNSRQYCPEIKREAWGYVEYDHALTKREINDYELVQSPR